MYEHILWFHLHVGGRQFKVTPNDLIVVNKIPADIGSEIYLEKVKIVNARVIPLNGKLLVKFLIWRYGEIRKDRCIRNSPIWINGCAPMVLRIQIAKFKFCQYLLKADLPNVMLAKVIPTIWYFTNVIIIITCMKLTGQKTQKQQMCLLHVMVL